MKNQKIISYGRIVLAALVGCFSFLPSLAALTGLADIKDMRVAPLLQSQWTVGDFGGDKAFNLYTPNNYSCGCGITAYLQVMRYWRAPAGAVAPASFLCWVGNESRTVSTMGGPYDWEAMPFLSDECVEQRQREALGRLAYDLGAASHVAWANNRYSYSYGVLSAAALTDYFGYVSARVFRNSQTGENILALDDYKNAILASLDAGMPVVIGLRTVLDQGHQAVVDGYGFGEDGKLYCHVNFGWNGASDLWYNLMENDFNAGDTIDTFQFHVLDEVTYNIHPEEAGDVISGRVLDTSGNPVPHATVRFSQAGRTSTLLAETATNEKGIYSFRFRGKGQYVVTANDPAHGSAEQKVQLKDGASVALSASINFAVPFSNFALYASSAGTVANSWGNDLVLKGGGLTPETPETPETPKPTEDPTPTAPLFTASAAATIDGLLLDGEKAAGTILVKAGKANKTTGESKLTATVILKGQPKKLSYKGIMAANGAATLSCSGQPDMTLTFDMRTMSGRLGGYTVSGTRNLFTSKDKAEVAEANGMLKPWLGVVNVVWAEGSLSAVIAAKGKVKVSGMLDGKKVSSTGQLLLGEAEHYIPVVIAKPVSLAFMLRLPSAGGAVEVSGIESCIAGTVGVLAPAARFSIDREANIWGMLQGTALVDQLPDVAVKQSGAGAKWIVPKAGKVVYQKGTNNVDSSKAGENPSGLKLTYKAKDGTFKGSFKVYCDVGGKLKATSVTVTGVQIGSKGYGTATIKGRGSVPVTIE